MVGPPIDIAHEASRQYGFGNVESWLLVPKRAERMQVGSPEKPASMSDGYHNCFFRSVSDLLAC
jgi:hypothetical protein